MAVVALLAFGPIVETDLGFHLATGRYILSHGSIPATNVLSFAEPAAASVNDEWLIAVLDALAFRISPSALVALRIALLLATFSSFYAAARAFGARAWPTALVIVLGASASAFRFLDRPYLFSNLTTALTLLGLAWSGVLCTRRRGLLLIAVASFAGPQLHAGAFFGVLLVLVSCLSSLAPERLSHLLRLTPSNKEAWQFKLAPLGAALGGWLLAALALCLYHPLPWGVLSLPFVLGSDPYLHQNVVECRAVWDQPVILLLPYWLFVLACVVALLGALRARQLPTLGVLMMASFGLALSLRHGRLVDLAVLFAAPLLALVISAETVRPMVLRITQALALRWSHDLVWSRRVHRWSPKTHGPLPSTPSCSVSIWLGRRSFRMAGPGPTWAFATPRSASSSTRPMSRIRSSSSAIPICARVMASLAGKRRSRVMALHL